MKDTPTTEQLAEVVDRICDEWANKGKLIEGGWWAYVATSGLDTAPEIQRVEMRKAFMLGAQHLFTSMLLIMDSDKEPTQRDLDRVELIHRELESFRRSLTH